METHGCEPARFIRGAPCVRSETALPDVQEVPCRIYMTSSWSCQPKAGHARSRASSRCIAGEQLPRFKLCQGRIGQVGSARFVSPRAIAAAVDPLHVPAGCPPAATSADRPRLCHGLCRLNLVNCSLRKIPWHWNHRTDQIVLVWSPFREKKPRKAKNYIPKGTVRLPGTLGGRRRRTWKRREK